MAPLPPPPTLVSTRQRRRLVAGAAALGLALGLGPLTAASAAPSDLAPLHDAPAASALAGSYIVVLDTNASTADVDGVQRLAVTAGATITRTYRSAVQGFAAQLSPSALSAVRAAAGVAYVEQNRTFALGADAVTEDDALAGKQRGATWGIDRIDQRQLPLNGTFSWKRTGKGVTAYVVDTGIRITHEEFEGRASYGVNTWGSGEADDCNGHGTHVAGTVGGKTYGVAKQVKLVAVRTLGCAGEGTIESVLAGIDWVIANASGPSLMNLSLGLANIKVWDDAVTAAFHAGIPSAVAAGNSRVDACAFSPARAPVAITVAASTDADARATFSNHGPCVDLYAPGENILSAGRYTDTATATASGTSMASPHVAGAVALIIQKTPNASPKKITKKLLKKTTKDIITGSTERTKNDLLFSKKF